jgi:hypothetical protein
MKRTAVRLTRVSTSLISFAHNKTWIRGSSPRMTTMDVMPKLSKIKDNSV